MELIRSYLLSVIAAALIFSILSALPGKNGSVGAIRKTLCGIFMAVTLIRPLADLTVPDPLHYLDSFHADAAEAVFMGQTMSQDSAAQIIKEQTAAYILDKAKQMGVSLEVTVTLTEAVPRIPCSVTLSGMVSPYLKQRLTDMIEEDLQIKREDQHWINTN